MTIGESGTRVGTPTYTPAATRRPVTTLGPVLGGGARPDEAPTRRDVARFLFRHRATITLSTLIVGLVIGVALYTLPPSFATSARLHIKTEGQAGPTFFGGAAAFRDDPLGINDAARLETEIQLLLALPLSLEVVERLQIREEQLHVTPLGHVMKPAVRAYSWFRENVLGRPRGVPDEQRAIAERLRGSITVSPVPSMTGEGLSNIIEVSLRAADPVMAQAALQALLEGYLGTRAEDDAAAGRAAERILAREVEKVRGELLAAEMSLRDFVAREGRNGRPAPLTAARTDAALTERRTQLANLEIRLAEARQKYTDDSPPVQMLLGEIGALEREIDRSVADGAMADARFGELSRAVAAAEQRHNELERRLGEARLFEAVMSEPLGDRSVVEPPLMPDGSDWKKRMVVGVLGVGAGFMLGLVLAGLAQVTDSRLRSKEDVMRHLGLPVLGVLPARRRAGKEAADPAARGIAARLAAAREQWGERGVARTVLVTSARDGEGTGTVAQLLAEQLANRGYGRVLLVRGRAGGSDGTGTAGRALPRPERRLNGARSGDAGDPQLLPTVPGRASAAGPTVLDLDAGDGDLAAAFSSDPLTGGVVPASRVGALIERVGVGFDWTVIDVGPLGEDEAHAGAQIADAVLLVVDSSTTRRAVVEDALRTVRIRHDAAVGVVLNRAEREIPAFLYERL